MKITKRQLRQIILENDRREELISVIYDIMMDNRSGDQEEDFAAAKDELESDGEATTDELDEIQLDDVLQMRGPLVSEQKIMKITKRQLRQIIREEASRLIEQPDVPDVMGAMGGGKFQPRPGLDADVAAEALAELKNDGWLSMIQAAATDAAGDLDRLSDQVDTKLLDAGLNELAVDLRNVVKMLDKIREAAHKQR